MVTMNAADDKENINQSNKMNGVIGEPTACSSTTCTENIEKNTSQIKMNGSSLQTKDCSKHPITNGAYPKVNSVSCSLTGVCENGGPSETRKNLTQASCGAESLQIGTSCGESEKGLTLRNSVDRYSENENHLINIQKQPKSKDKGAFDYDRNSSSEDEECCIYTYKGDSSQVADLPSSFFRLDFMSSRPNANSRNSSPDMDYLEMDFDPGPSNDRYSSSDSECDERGGEEQFGVEVSSLPQTQTDYESAPEPDVNPPTPLSPLSTPSPVLYVGSQYSPEQQYLSGPVFSPPPSPHTQPIAQDVDTECLQPAYCYCVDKALPVVTAIDEHFNEGDNGTMVWKEEEAKEKHVTQIGKSLCGATAVVNTLLGLKVQFSVNIVKEHVATRFRNETASLAEYLFSRCHAGATHVDMIRALQAASQDLVYARFFHMFPQRNISLTTWLSHWIKKGAVPIATVNLQQRVQPDAEIPDFWHHQMIYGVGEHGIYLTNPLEIQTESCLWPQLSSQSVLMVRRDDVLSRWTPETSLHPLIDPQLSIWRKMNVLGQVVNVIREDCSGSYSTQYITIPASYSSGITIALLRTNPACDELRIAPELPIEGFPWPTDFSGSFGLKKRTVIE